MSFQNLFLIAISVFCANAISYAGQAPTPLQEMNGIKFDNYKNFDKEWSLVTVRFRKDSNEMRFIYANDIAMKELNSLKPNYPDGAVFAKIGFIAEEDPVFPSSLMPAGTKRFQFMVKDKKKYKTSDGWGYALFNSEGQVFEEDLQAKTQSCIACHRIVPERDYVFARSFNGGHGSPWTKTEFPNKTSISFKQEKVSKFDGEARTILAENNFKTAETLSGDLQKYAFSGTLDEIIPLLVEHAQIFKSPSILFLNKDNFSLVVPTKSDSCLGANAFDIKIFFNSRYVRKSTFCK
jgi:hypothetical protein